ncbi:hypothetical protein [Streptomyces sp. ISL-11]|uniref:hypothetical protein n=1 Tax=Streptomyces sp. ISL-11 TaxID=2819174 RepID=UPI001BEAC301|nr:hypothetical protein [Streptomyces sp. ISL-11]MBT2384379.1 hypothetical protein [Streptomyces sp. ISL-11]
MTTSRSWAVRASALATATALLVLGAPATASAQCADPHYHGGRTFPGGSCPENVADAASGTVWAVLVLAAGLWIAVALSRHRSTTAADLAAIDEAFSRTTPGTATAAPGWAPPPPSTPPLMPARGEDTAHTERQPPSA